jgi:hypothetical protein
VALAALLLAAYRPLVLFSMMLYAVLVSTLKAVLELASVQRQQATVVTLMN